jgi:serine phosphatase RsbU (regulator of sigma subunit)
MVAVSHETPCTIRELMMATPDDPTSRIAALQQVLHREKAVTVELEKRLHSQTRELKLAIQQVKRQARQIGARTAIALLAQHATLERAAPSMLEALGKELGWQLVQLLMVDPTTKTMRCRVQWASPQVGAIAPGVGSPGRVSKTAKPEWISTVSASAARAGFQSGCAFPIIVDGAVHAIIEMFAVDACDPDLDLLDMLGTLGNEIGKLIEHSNAQDQLRFNELQIARHIQTAILPRDLAVDRLEVAATMVPATEVGGDYYDVLPFPGGAWLGIGDVTGHGVGAGMIMLMVQSAVAALTRDQSRVSPRDVLLELNTFLYDNIRRRLREQDHVTFTLLRYTDDGVVRFAGAHEDIVIWRADNKRCEIVESAGVWAGAVPSVAAMTQDLQLQLEPGDILVLYTDGLTEGRDAAREQFGLQRLCDVVTELASTSRPISEICDEVIRRALRWCATQADDISLVMARYHGDEVVYDFDSTVLQEADQ